MQRCANEPSSVRILLNEQRDRGTHDTKLEDSGSGTDTRTDSRHEVRIFLSNSVHLAGIVQVRAALSGRDDRTS